MIASWTFRQALTCCPVCRRYLPTLPGHRLAPVAHVREAQYDTRYGAHGEPIGFHTYDRAPCIERPVTHSTDRNRTWDNDNMWDL